MLLIIQFTIFSSFYMIEKKIISINFFVKHLTDLCWKADGIDKHFLFQVIFYE